MHAPNQPRDRRRGMVAPRFLDPILALAEWIDRRVRRITPLGPDAVLAVERHRHRGSPLSLGDGTVVRGGDRADIVHFVNRRLRELAGEGWQQRAMDQARVDFGLLTGRLASMPVADRPVAFHGATVLAPYAVRMGWELHPRRRSAWHRVEDWYLRSLLPRWSPAGRERLRHGRGALAVGEVWISAERLLALFPPPAPQ